MDSYFIWVKEGMQVAPQLLGWGLQRVPSCGASLLVELWQGNWLASPPSRWTLWLNWRLYLEAGYPRQIGVGHPWPCLRSSCIGPYFGGCFCWRWQATHRWLILQHFDEDVQKPRFICNGCCLGKVHPPELCLLCWATLLGLTTQASTKQSVAPGGFIFHCIIIHVSVNLQPPPIPLPPKNKYSSDSEVHSHSVTLTVTRLWKSNSVIITKI